MTQKLAIWRKPRLGVRGRPSPFPVCSPYTSFGVEGRVRRHGTLEHLDVVGRIVRMNQRKPPVFLHFFERGAEEFAVGAVHKADAALGVGDPHDRRAAVGHDPEATFSFPQDFLSVLACVDIFDMDDGVQRCAGAIQHLRDPGVRPHFPAGPMQVPFFHLQHREGIFPQQVPCCHRILDIVRMDQRHPP